ncbi:MAG TPA: ABC transporter permease [Cytophagales bacterium]|nr:ABC transporter permease [Cytophagales bacterium]
MFKLWATLVKDFRILTRDRVGLTLMFIMPIILVIVITSIQSSTFELVNDNKVPLILSNRDNGKASQELIVAIKEMGMFEISETKEDFNEKEIADFMHKKDALIAIIIPKDFSNKISLKAKDIAGKALNEFGVTEETGESPKDLVDPLTLYYHPVLQESFRYSIQGALRSALQIVESKEILQTLYFSLNEKELPKGLENEIINNQIPINEIPVSRDGSRNIPNATQHNIPAWTVFAMFFVVISLGSSVVKEKLSGSFIRLKTLPTSYFIALISKQISYLLVTLAQVVVIFSIGVFLFPLIGLPKLNLPSDLVGLLIVSLISGWCAISYAIAIGVFAQTQEQANGFGAVSIVILAAIGGILVPSFAMPESFQVLMILSPLHWCLESYYGLFLEGGTLGDIIMNLIPLLAIITVLQIIVLLGLKRKNLV